MLRLAGARVGVSRRRIPAGPTSDRPRADDEGMAASVLVVDDDDRFRGLACGSWQLRVPPG